MNVTDRSPAASTFAALRRFSKAAEKLERCEWCGVGLGAEHRHLLEMGTRTIICACDPCALRFQAVVDGKYKLIPRDARIVTEFQMGESEWEDLALPINLAFLYYDTPAGKVTALYPGPAGVTESLLGLGAWDELVRANQVLAGMERDVEALLVNRVGEARDYFIAPIDVCFELVGLIRIHWRGLSGGTEAWREIGRFFERLRVRSRQDGREEGARA
jgi:hypothetical protein